jgi:hypothetical protein
MRCVKSMRWREGEAGAPVTVVWLPGRRAGLEGVEKSLPAPSTARTQRSGTPACCCSSPASRTVASLVERLLVLAPRRPSRGRRRPTEARPQLLRHDLHDLPAARHRDPEHGPGDPASVCRSSGSSVRLPAKLTLASFMVLPFLLPGRAFCPALPLDLGDGGHRGMPREHQGQATEPAKSAMDRLPSALGSGAVLVGALAAGGRTCHLPSGQIPPPWAWWENEAPAARAARSSSQVQPSERVCELVGPTWSVQARPRAPPAR